MSSFRVGMRWWLALAFALIAALTAVAVAEVFTARSEDAFRERAADLAVGNSVAAADELTPALLGDDLDRAAQEVAARRRLAVFVFGPEGRLLTRPRSRRTSVQAVDAPTTLAFALNGDRYVAPVDEGRATIVGLPLPLIDGALVTYSSRPELVAQLGIVRSKIVEAAVLAVVVGAIAGLLVATLIARRLRRIAAAAADIEAGSFERPLPVGFRDEVGDLAETIDRMRERLRESFLQLEAERDRLRRLLERLHDGVITLDHDLNVQFANATALGLLGPAGLAEGAPLPDPWDELSLRALAKRLFAPRTQPVQEVVAVDGDRTFAVSGIPAGRDAETAVLVVTDISERERRERAEREFVTNAAHELRTPLTTITGAIDVLQAGAKDDPEQRDRFLSHIQRESGRLARLTRALLVLARAQTKEEQPRLTAVELRPLLTAVAADLRPADEVQIDVRCPPGIAAFVEPDLIEQALVNLAANAVGHTERGSIVLSAYSDDGTVVIEVADTGTGIAPEQHERVFDRFYRGESRNADGFGLGLAIVEQAVSALGGTVEIESRPGAGTTARIRVPAARTLAPL